MKIFLLAIGVLMMFPLVVNSDIVVEELEVPGYTDLQPRGIADDNENIVLMAVPVVPDPVNQGHKAVWFNNRTKQITIMPYAAPSDPYRVTDIDSDGSIACGFDKGNGHISTWQMGVGLRTYPAPTGYRYARAVAINRSGAVVGFVEDPQSGGHQKQAVYKKGSPSVQLELFQHPNAYQETEFVSIDNTGDAIGRTDSGYVFVFNVNTESWNNIVLPPPPAPPAPPIVGFSEEFFSPTFIPPMLEGLDNEKADINEKSEMAYTYYDSVDQKNKAVILDKETGFYEIIDLPVDGQDIFIDGYNSNGKLIGYSADGSAFIATVTHEVSIQDVPYDYFVYRDSSDEMYMGIDLRSLPFEIQPVDSSQVPIRVIVEMGNITDMGETVRYIWTGTAVTHERPWGVYFDIP